MYLNLDSFSTYFNSSGWQPLLTPIFPTYFFLRFPIPVTSNSSFPLSRPGIPHPPECLNEHCKFNLSKSVESALGYVSLEPREKLGLEIICLEAISV